jgi:hypothetical protein
MSPSSFRLTLLQCLDLPLDFFQFVGDVPLHLFQFLLVLLQQAQVVLAPLGSLIEAFLAGILDFYLLTP